MHKYKNNNLPTEIQILIDNHLQRTPVATRSRSNIDLIPERRLSKGNIIFDIIDNWNNFNYTEKETAKIGALKNKINEIQNKILPCEQSNCYTCKNK